MNRKQYFNNMVETSEHVNPFILKSIKQEDDSLYQLITNLPQFKKRVQKGQKLRPFLLRLAYEIDGGKNWNELIPACAATEILNISTYIDNAVLDSKGDVTDTRDYLIAGRILRNRASKIIRENYGDANLEDLLVEIDSTIYTGQYSDLHQFSYEEAVKMAEGEFLDHYINRCYRLTGKFLENVANMGSLLASKQNSKMRVFGGNFGISVQITNDIGDFVPPMENEGCDTEKIYQDQYSDIRNGKITLPIYYTLKNSQREDQEHLINILSGKMRSVDDLKEVTDILLRNGAIDYSKRIAGKFARKAKIILSSYKQSSSRDCLSLMTQLYRTNKYIATLREYGK